MSESEREKAGRVMLPGEDTPLTVIAFLPLGGPVSALSSKSLRVAPIYLRRHFVSRVGV